MGETTTGSGKREPSRTAKLARGIAIAAVIVLPMALGFGPELCQEMEDRDVIENGVLAEARILDLEDTGNRMNDNPEVLFDLEIDLREGGTYRAAHRTYMSPVDIVKYRPGETVNVKYDPADPSRVVLLPW